MGAYTISENRKLDNHITFLRIKPNDINLTLMEVFESLSDLSWIDNFDKDYMKDSFRLRAQTTIDNLEKKLVNGDDDNITSESGESVVSELARKSIVNELNYLDIPLAELFKQKKDGNPGFDFYSENNMNIILFGEAKYVSQKNAYGKALNQIIDFTSRQKDIEDLVDLKNFCSEESLENVSLGNKGYAVAFSSTEINTEKLINNLTSNEDYKNVSKFSEVICIAVDL